MIILSELVFLIIFVVTDHLSFAVDVIGFFTVGINLKLNIADFSRIICLVFILCIVELIAALASQFFESFKVANAIDHDHKQGEKDW